MHPPCVPERQLGGRDNSSVGVVRLQGEYWFYLILLINSQSWLLPLLPNQTLPNIAWWDTAVSRFLSTKLRGPGGRPRASTVLGWMDCSFLSFPHRPFLPSFSRSGCWATAAVCLAADWLLPISWHFLFLFYITNSNGLTPGNNSFGNIDALMRSSFGISSSVSGSVWNALRFIAHVSQEKNLTCIEC